MFWRKKTLLAKKIPCVLDMIFKEIFYRWQLFISVVPIISITKLFSPEFQSDKGQVIITKYYEFSVDTFTV